MLPPSGLKEIGHRRLAGPRLADDGHRGAGIDAEVHPADDLLAGDVGEIDLSEFQLAAGLVVGQGPGRIGLLTFFVDNLEDPLGAGEGGHDRVPDVGDVVEGADELPRPGEEARDEADGNAALEREQASDDGDGGEAQVAEDVHDGHEIAGPNLGPGTDAGQARVAGREGIDGERLETEGLDGLHAADALLDAAIDLAEGILLLPEELACPLRNGRREEKDEGNGDEAREGEEGIDKEHDDEGDDDCQTARDELNGGLGEGDAHRVDIVGDPAHEIAMAPPVEEGKRQGEEGSKERGPEAADKPLREAGHDPTGDGGR